MTIAPKTKEKTAHTPGESEDKRQPNPEIPEQIREPAKIKVEVNRKRVRGALTEILRIVNANGGLRETATGHGNPLMFEEHTGLPRIRGLAMDAIAPIGAPITKQDIALTEILRIVRANGGLQTITHGIGTPIWATYSSGLWRIKQ